MEIHMNSVIKNSVRLSVLAGLACASVAMAQPVQSVRYIGQQSFNAGTIPNVAGTTVGGISGLTYTGGNSYLGISDDRSGINPARFYSINVVVDESLPAAQRVNATFTAQTTLLRGDGTAYPINTLDPEGIALAAGGASVFVSSEGEANLGASRVAAPFVNRYNRATGQLESSLPVNARYTPTFSGTTQVSGVRNNLAFESLTISPSQNFLFTATENALQQDGLPATVLNGTNSRIVRYDLRTNTVSGEFVYTTDPVSTIPNPANGFATNGLVELLALEDGTLLALERSFGVGATTIGNTGNNSRLYQITLNGATDVSGMESLAGQTFTSVTRTLLLDFGTLGIAQDNLEALVLGPTLPTGERLLLVGSDNNFSPTQFTQFIALGVTFVPAPGAAALLGLGGLLVARRRR
jgi:3-phytase